MTPSGFVRTSLLSMAVLIAAAGAQRAYALDKKFSSVVAHYILGSFYEKTGKIDRAIAEYEKALRQDDKNPHAHMSLGVAYLKKNNIPRAVEELNLASKYDPDAVEPHAILALLYFSQENAQAAGREYETALTKASQLDPTNINIYRSLAVVHLHKKNFTAAESTFNLILKISPKDAEALFYLANVYDETGRDNLVEKTLRACLEIKPDYAQALNYLGYFFAETNRNLAEAENLIKKALQAEPENGAYADSLGWVYFKQGKIKEAAAELEKAKDLLDDPVIYDHLGDVYLKLKDTGRAKDNWLKSLKLDGSQEKVKKKLESIK